VNVPGVGRGPVGGDHLMRVGHATQATVRSGTWFAWSAFYFPGGGLGVGDTVWCGKPERDMPFKFDRFAHASEQRPISLARERDRAGFQDHGEFSPGILSGRIRPAKVELPGPA